MITIVNVRNSSNYIYCARGSALGNPFFMRNEAQRDLVCDKYEDWFYSVIDEPNFLISRPSIESHPQTHQLIKIYNKALFGNINLGCYCAPKRCHCETIKTFIENKLNERLK